MGTENTDHNPSSNAIRQLLLDNTVLLTDFVLCSECGCLTTKKYWDVHLGTHQDFDEVVEVLREVSFMLFGKDNMSISEEAQRIITHWRLT